MISMDGLYVDENIIRYLSGSVVLLVLWLWVMLYKDGGQVLRVQAWTWFALMIAQLVRAIPLFSQEQQVLTGSAVVAYWFYWLSGIGVGWLFSITYLDKRSRWRRYVIGASAAYALLASIYTVVAFTDMSPQYTDAEGITHEFSLLFRAVHAGAHLLYLPVGIFILRKVAPVYSGMHKVVAYLYGVLAILTTAAGLAFVVGGEATSAVVYAIVILLGLLLLLASILRRTVSPSKK